MRVHEAVREAFEKGGISREDFPSSIRHLACSMLAGDAGRSGVGMLHASAAERRR